jgi:hypothetical protein
MEIPVLKSLSRRQRKLVYWLFGLFVSYTILGFLVLPPIIRAVAVKQLTKQFDREVSIQKVKLNPFALSATVRGLLIKDKDGQPFVSWDEVYVNFQLSSLFGKAWVFKEVSTTKPFVRVQMNKDSTFNFSDLITKFSTNTPSAAPAKPSPPLALRINKLHIAGAAASFTDLTPRTPFARVIGSLDVTLENFRTDPDNKNPYSFAGSTDAGEKFAWSGYFYLTPLRSQGDFSLRNISLNKYAPLYQDFVKFNIKDGVVDIRSTYHFELSTSNRVASVTNFSFALHSLKVSEPGGDINFVEQPEFAVTGASVDAVAHHAEVDSITSSGGRLWVQRNKDATINVVEFSKPAETADKAPGGIVFLLRSVTNAVAMILNSTNQWTGIIHDVNLQNGALSLVDLVNSRPVRLDLDNITLIAKNISNVPGTNLTTELSLRWNTNGTIKTDVSASFLPPTVDIALALDQLDLHPLDPYLESKLNLLIIGSKLGLNGKIRLRTPPEGLPNVTFQGDAWLDDFSTVDGVLAEDLLKWKSVRVSGIDANLNPQTVAIKEIAVTDAYARLIIETNHTINLLAVLHADNTSASAETNITVAAQQTSIAQTNSESAPKISIASIVISNAQTQFTDRSFTPNVSMGVEQLRGTIAGLSSDEMQHADVNLSAQVDGIGPVEITGTINPLVKNQTTDLKIKVRNVDLTPTSPYVGQFAGYRLAKGKFEADLTYHVADRKIKAANVITLNQFTFGEKVNSPDATHLPVRLAVAILKDRSGKIVFDVPVEGSLDDPQFKLHKVITHAILNIITKISTSPFAVLGAVFGGHGDELSYQDFAPGSSEVQPGAKEKLNSLVNGLYERPGLQLAIEGSIDPVADRDGLRQVKLEKQLRAQKWMSLRKSERTSVTAEQVTLTPDERSKFVKELYRDALARGEIVLTAQKTNQTGAATTTAPKTRSTETGKGATLLMRGYNQVTGSFSTNASPANPPTTTSNKTQAPGAADELEQALLDSINVTDSDLETLATERAKAVRAYVLQSGRVEAERIYLTEIQPGGVKTQGSRAYLQLQ